MKTPCIHYAGRKDRDGYAAAKISGKNVRLHKFIYETLVEKVASGFELDHTCRNRGCINPLHLEPVTHQQNVLRGNAPSAVNARKTHCINGHPLSGNNLRIIKSSGYRVCRICANKHK